jgi:membrane protease YdiL (CAAX protease family)
MQLRLHGEHGRQNGVSMHRYQPIAEALALLFVTLPLAVGLGIPTLWFVLPFALVSLTRRPYPEYGLSVENPGSFRFHVAVITVVFVPYLIGHYLLAHWTAGLEFHFRLPARFATSAVDQVLLIALPEEFFFRGYLQTQLDRVYGRPHEFLGAKWGVGLLAAAALFAACHVVHGGPVRLIVFFPGLVYGWLRARTDTILVPTFYHAGSNLLMQIMLASLSQPPLSN